MNRGAAGARTLNLDLQAALNLLRDGQTSVERFGFTFRVGDKVMQIANNYDKEIFNGDFGFVAAIDAEGAEVMIDFDGRSVAYPLGELDEIVMAYATTIHLACAICGTILAQASSTIRRGAFTYGDSDPACRPTSLSESLSTT